MDKSNKAMDRCLVIALCVFGVGSIGVAHGDDVGMLYGVRAVNGQLIIRSLDLGSSARVQERGKLSEQSGERLTALFQNKDRGVGVIRTSINAKAARRASIRMVGIPTKPVDMSAADVTGLSSAYSISSVLIPIAGPPLALVAHYSDTPRFWLANVNLGSGQVTLLNTSLDPRTRYSHLTQCPDSGIYAVSMAPQYDVRLVQFDLTKQTVRRLGHLLVKDRVLQVELQGLACGPSGQLYGLSDPEHSGTNSVFRIDTATGEMTLVAEFDVDRMIFVR
ncbi:MAG: hypothetical protein ABI612_19055 [Betaproteobacteria bacterium]